MENYSIKKGRKTLAVFGPTSTYEKQPFWEGMYINSKAMPIKKMAILAIKKDCFSY